jgi:hypothetical protein
MRCRPGAKPARRSDPALPCPDFHSDADRMRRFLLATLLAAPSILQAGCPTGGEGRVALDALKAAGFQTDAAARGALALDLVDCLGAPDPALRDGIAYEALAHWLRGAKLEAADRVALFDALLLQLRGADDADGFRRPFAALVLSEVAASDVAQPWLDAARRSALLEAAVAYVSGVRDYRGFDERSGWRHGVAHGADLLLHLARHPRVDRAGLDRILSALAAQVAPASGHAYVDGESERLARALLHVALRGEHDGAAWDRWFAALAGPGPLGRWDAAFTSRAGLARRHNLLAFLRAAYEGAREAGEPKLDVLLPGLREAFKIVP